jgi:Carboxypeptidase regulatory-like domain
MPAKPIVVGGVVRGPGGEELPQARVFIAKAPVPVPDVAALTDAEGRFTLSLPAAGRYEVACVVEGYAPLSATVEVADEQGLQLELQLPPDAPGR